jgi:hypothetical protein
MTPAFPTERFLKTVARLGSDNDHERAIAAKQATALLTQAGLTWEQVLRPGLPAATRSSTVHPSVGPGPVMSPFEDLFASLFNVGTRGARPAAGPSPSATPSAAASTPASAAPRFRRTGHTIVQGNQIPSVVKGRPVIRERTEYAPGKFKMILGLLDDEGYKQYDPLVLFNRDSMDLIENALKEDADAVIGGRVKAAEQPGHLPVFMLTWGY